MGRSNIAVDDAVADRLSDEARKENKTLYALANEALLSVLDVTQGGGSLKQVYPSWKFVSMLRDVGCLVLPEALVEKMAARMHIVDREWLLKAWYDEGVRLGDFLKMSAPEPGDLGRLIEEFQILIPAQKIEFKKLGPQGGNSSVASDRGTVYEIRALGTGQSSQTTACADQFIRGMFSSYSLKIISDNVSRGIISIKARETAKPSSPQ